MKTIFTILSILLLVGLSSSSRAQCTISNAGFETWTDGNPDGWFALTCRQSPGRVGGSCLETDTAVVFPFIFPPIFGTVETCTTRSAYLNGYVKAAFSPVDTDTLIFTVGFKLQGDTMPGAFGSCYTVLNRANWTPFHIPITNLMPGPVDTMVITGSMVGIHSLVSFDDLAFSATPLGQPLGPTITASQSKKMMGRKQSTISIAPNPISGTGFIDLSGISGQVKIRIVDMAGKTVQQTYDGQISENTRLPINVSGIKPGIYLIVTESASGILNKRIAVR